MATLIVPPLDRKPWPTLGPELCDWIEANLVYGPGPKKGEPYVVEPEFRGELYRMYEVFPRGHARAGRRRFKRAALSKRKGTAKSEKGAIIAAAELHPRCAATGSVGRVQRGCRLVVAYQAIRTCRWSPTPRSSRKIWRSVCSG
jgi:hypothetical protein